MVSIQTNAEDNIEDYNEMKTPNRLQGELKNVCLIVCVFLGCFFLPVGTPRFDNALIEALELTKWYAREHVLLCLIPAFFIAGAISVFISQTSVMKFLGPQANKTIAYGVASVSGSILAVCSCTVLPLFSGIYKMGAGLGPATAFLYSGPAINVIAMILTLRVLGSDLGIARIVGAVSFSVVIGLIMHYLYRKEEIKKINAQLAMPIPANPRPLWQTAIFFTAMIAILVFANWSKVENDGSFWYRVFKNKWELTAFFGSVLSVILVCWIGIRSWKVLSVLLLVLPVAILFDENPLIPFALGFLGLTLITSTDEDGESGEWFSASWDFAKQILPILLFGVMISGFLLGRPGHEGIIPSEWINQSVGGNSLKANFIASFVGAFMYFATLTEIPIVQGLLGSGMGKGPALSLLLAGPALSLPSMLVINKVLGPKKTITYVMLVIVMATISGKIFGLFY